MSRLMSCAMTVDAVLARTKTVTRRAGWWQNIHGRPLVTPGDELCLVKKAMGRKPGEPLVRLAYVQVLDVSREVLCSIMSSPERARAELAAEGFPILNGEDPLAAASTFLRRYFYEPQRMRPMDNVTRIEWRYLPDAVPTFGRVWTDKVDLHAEGGGWLITVKRACNGCGRELGDALEQELDAAMVGRRLPDVTAECVCRYAA